MQFRPACIANSIDPRSFFLFCSDEAIDENVSRSPGEAMPLVLTYPKRGLEVQTCPRARMTRLYFMGAKDLHHYEMTLLLL